MAKLTTHKLKKMKAAGERITMLTAYDYPMAKLLDGAGVDMLLVGDSLGPVVLGYDDTTRVTMEDMVHHTQAVVRGAEHAMVVADLPYLSYHLGIPEAIRNGGRLIQEGGAGAVKLEGGEKVADTIRAMVDAGIPVMGHIGLTPQAILTLGGHFIQGKTDEAAQQLIRDAKILEESGVFAIVLECVPKAVGAAVTEAVSVPTIGIGAGAGCDGQVLVSYDMLGLFQRKVPSFVKPYEDLSALIDEGVRQYVAEVKAGQFPTDDYSF